MQRAYLLMLPLLKNEITKDIVQFQSCAKQIEYDIKHGVSMDEVLEVMRKIRRDKRFHDLQKIPEFLQRVDELQKQISGPKKVTTSWY